MNVLKKEKSTLQAQKNCAFKKISYHYKSIFASSQQIEKINQQLQKLRKGGLFD